MLALREVYPSLFALLVKNAPGAGVQAWDTVSNPAYCPGQKGGRIVLVMTYPHESNPRSVAHRLSSLHTRRCAVMLHEVGEAVLWYSGWRDRDKTPLGLPIVSRYANESLQEAFCEALALVVLSHARNPRWFVSGLGTNGIKEKQAFDTALQLMGLSTD